METEKLYKFDTVAILPAKQNPTMRNLGKQEPNVSKNGRKRITRSQTLAK